MGSGDDLERSGILKRKGNTRGSGDNSGALEITDIAGGLNVLLSSWRLDICGSSRCKRE